MKTFNYPLIIFLFLCIEVQGSNLGANDTIPPNFPDISTFQTNEAAPGYIYYTSLVNPYRLVILDQSGIPVYFNDQVLGANSNFRYQNDNLYTFANQSNDTFIAMDSNYTLIDTFRMGPGYEADFHDIQITPSGNVILMAYDVRQVDMSQIVPGGDPDATVQGLVLQELDPDENVVFEWRSWDHFEITDGLTNGYNPIDFTDDFIPYVHCNSIDVDHDGNWIISSRHMSEVTKINRQTGDIIWRMGGLNNEFTFINDPFNGFTDQHDARRLDNGNIIIFDNGLNHVPPTTRVVEYLVDEVNKVATLVWSYENPSEQVTQISGTAQRLDNGNTFIYWGRRTSVIPSPTNMAVEVDQNGNTVFELFFNMPGQVGFVYRIFKLPWNDPEVLTGVMALPELEVEVKPAPNPANQRIQFQIQVEKSDQYLFLVSDAQGRILSAENIQLLSGELNEHTFGTSDLPAGVYFYTLLLSGKLSSGRFLVIH